MSRLPAALDAYASRQAVLMHLLQLGAAVALSLGGSTMPMHPSMSTLPSLLTLAGSGAAETNGSGSYGASLTEIPDPIAYPWSSSTSSATGAPSGEHEHMPRPGEAGVPSSSSVSQRVGKTRSFHDLVSDLAGTDGYSPLKTDVDMGYPGSV
jgi:hypothetical protein